MTFQVVLIGSDGLVVGSDRTQMYVTTGSSGIRPAGQRSQTFKFKVNDDSRVICAFAGNPSAHGIALQIVSNCRPTPSETDWESSLKSAADSEQSYQAGRFDEVIAVRADVFDAAWVVTKLSPQAQPAQIMKITEHLCTGDPSVSYIARFLPFLLWKRSPVSDLKALALLTLAYASQANPSSVGGGFDLMTLQKGQKPKWERYETKNASLKKLHRAFDEKLKELFAKCSKLALQGSSKP